MADTDELADLRAHLKRLERQRDRAADQTRRHQELVLARVLVMIATVALALSVSMGWYADVEIDDENVELVSGWLYFSETAGGDAVETFVGWYSWVVVLAALAAGLGVFTLTQRWLAITLTTLLGLLAAGYLFLDLIAAGTNASDEQLAGVWCAMFVMAGCSVAWGNLVRPLRELATEELYRDFRG